MPRNRYTRDLLYSAVKDSRTWAEVCRKLGVKPATGAQTHVKSRANDFGVDFSHFLGQAHNRGKIFGSKQPIEFYLVQNSNAKSHTLKLRLIKEGIKKEVCEECGLKEWLGLPIPLELDHINNNHWDNRLENLKILCPNCHSMRHKNMHS